MTSHLLMALEELTKSDVMKHLIESLNEGRDIGHYGRLVFVMVGRHFLTEQEVVEMLMKDPDCNDAKARGLLRQVAGRGYNPPKRERILQWMNEQEFPICENPQNPDACNVYKSLQFPENVYNKISSYYAVESQTEEEAGEKVKA